MTFENFFNNDNVDLPQNVSPSSPNHDIHPHCIISNAKLENTKDHLKAGTLQTMLNQKCYDAQHQLGKILENEILGPCLKTIFKC